MFQKGFQKCVACILSTWPNPPQTSQNPFRIDFDTCLFVCNPAVPAGVGSSSVLFYFFVHDGGDVALRTSVYSSNFAPISATLRQRAFWKITYFRFFDADMAQPSSNLPKSASSVLFLFFVRDGGDVALRTSLYPSNFALISATLGQRAVWKITNFRVFDADMAQPSPNLPKSVQI